MDEEKRKTCSWRERVEMKTKGREIEKTALLFSELQKEKKKQTNKEIKEKTLKKGLRVHDLACIDIDRSRFMYIHIFR